MVNCVVAALENCKLVAVHLSHKPPPNLPAQSFRSSQYGAVQFFVCTRSLMLPSPTQRVFTADNVFADAAQIFAVPVYRMPTRTQNLASLHPVSRQAIGWSLCRLLKKR